MFGLEDFVIYSLKTKHLVPVDSNTCVCCLYRNDV
jgi:hypothetical protein